MGGEHGTRFWWGTESLRRLELVLDGPASLVAWPPMARQTPRTWLFRTIASVNAVPFCQILHYPKPWRWSTCLLPREPPPLVNIFSTPARNMSDIIKTALLIVGAGPAGAALACFLASHGMRSPNPGASPTDGCRTHGNHDLGRARLRRDAPRAHHQHGRPRMSARHRPRQAVHPSRLPRTQYGPHAMVPLDGWRGVRAPVFVG